MKKIRLVVATIAFMFILAIATTVHATTYNASITYGDIKDGKLVITATFSTDLTEEAKESAKGNGYTVKDSKNLTREINTPSCGFWQFNITGSTEKTYYLEYSETPFEMEVNTSLNPIGYTIDNLASSNPSVIKIEDGKFVAVNAGTATITGTANLSNNKKINISYKGTVVDPNGTTSGDDSDKTDPTPTPGDDSDKTDPTPTPGGDSDKTDPTPTPGGDSNKIDPTPIPSTDDNINSFEWIDGSKVKVTATSDKYKYITVQTNIKPNENAHYYVYFSKKADENVTFESIKNTKNCVNINKNKEGVLEYKTFNTNINELSGDTYMYIIERCMDYKDVNYGKDKVIVKAQKVEKDTLPAYGERLDIFVVDPNENSAFSMLGTTNTRKLNYKIGKINSDDILRAFKNESSDSAFKKLYDYAKSAKILEEGTISMGESKPNIVSNMKLEDNGYYFIYLSLDTENGKYDEVDDIAIYRAITSDGKNKMVHFAFNTIDVADKEEKNEEDQKKEDSKKEDKKDDSQAPTNIPQTGATSTIGVIIAITLAVGTIGFVGYKKYNGIK